MAVGRSQSVAGENTREDVIILCVYTCGVRIHHDIFNSERIMLFYSAPQKWGIPLTGIRFGLARSLKVYERR